MTIEMDMYYQIRTYRNEGMSIRWIARTLGIFRQTVKKYCDGETIPGNRKEYHRQSSVVTPEIETFILQCFAEDEREGLAKQQHTAKRIYDRLVVEKDFSGGESTIRKAVNDLRKKHAVPSQADIPLEYDPGDAIQIDWGECTVYLDGVKKKLYSFCGRLCYSCDIFVQLFYKQNLECFLEAQQRMFDYFGGIPARLIFDNAKVAVKEGFGKHAVATSGYAAFAAHYAFKTDFCNIASGNEKGLVENLVGYSRRNFMVPLPRAKDIEELNEKLLTDCLNYRHSHKVQSKTISVEEAYQVEQRYLHPIPMYKYDTSKTATPDVGDYSTVRFEKNNYSVPVKYLRRTVTVKGYADKVLIIDVAIPIYHYANKESLEKGVGHLNGSSLPIGGENTHCVLTGHRGMPNAKLFTDLNLLKEGNRFYLKVLNETLVYEVYQIETVLPDDTESLAIVEGEDLCTLITCTPYGVNTHRLLVHAKRVYEESDEAVSDSKVTIQDRKTSILIQLLSAALGAYIAILFLWLLKRRNRRGQKKVD